jgi:hypothetical protein
MHEAAALEGTALVQRLLQSIEKAAWAVRETRQPTMRRAKTSITKAT